MEVMRVGRDFRSSSSISTSKSMFCVDESQDKPERNRRVTGDSSGNTKLREQEQRILKGEHMILDIVAGRASESVRTEKVAGRN